MWFFEVWVGALWGGRILWRRFPLSALFLFPPVRLWRGPFWGSRHVTVLFPFPYYTCCGVPLLY